LILLDTNVIAELVKAHPNPLVLAYVSALAPETAFTAAIREADIRYGLARLPHGRRRDDLTARIATFFETGFPDLILRFDRACAAHYGEMRRAREATGKPISIEDAMIAATTRAYGVEAIATRNTKDFTDCGVSLIDPWQAP
jgi:predicted nucleic acid-binding protein